VLQSGLGGMMKSIRKKAEDKKKEDEKQAKTVQNQDSLGD